MIDLTAKILTAVSKPGGASARELRDCLKGPQRTGIKITRDAMVRAGQIFCATNRFPGNARASVRYFATPERADDWAAQQADFAKAAKPLPTMFPKRPPKRVVLSPGASVIVNNVKPVPGPSCYDYRYTVRDLPKGYVSGLNTAECSPWAVAASQRA